MGRAATIAAVGVAYEAKGKSGEHSKLRLVMNRILTMLLLISLSPVHAAEGPYGYFVGTVQTEWLDADRSMRLLAPFMYVDPKKREWHAPAGSIIDGATIPKWAWSIIGGPFDDNYRRASVIHDVACVEKQRPWEVVHEAFYYATLAAGLNGVRARIMYAAVYHFGPRWDRSIMLTIDSKPLIDRRVREMRAEIDPRSEIAIGRMEAKPKPGGSASARTTIFVKAPPKRLSEEDFAQLRAEIEASANSRAGPKTLEEIRNYEPRARQ